MATLHVVGINFQLRLCEHACVVAHHDVRIALISVRLLRINVNINLSIEHPFSVVEQYAFVKLIAVTIRNLMVNERMIIDHLIVLREVGSA